MPNTNCLEGIACPKCGYEEKFYIRGFSTLEVTDAGVWDHSDSDWDDDCRIQCDACEWTGKVKDAKVGEVT